MKTYALMGALFVLAGCSAQVRHVPVELPLIARPTLPSVQPSEVQCLADDVYNRLVLRERGYKTWGLEYEAEVKANNTKASGKH